MQNAIEYVFDTQPQAYRFLNTAKHLQADNLKVKYGQSNFHVRVSYRIKTGEFDTMLAQLDDLASELGGREI